MAQLVGYSIGAILLAVVILVTWSKSGKSDWPLG